MVVQGYTECRSEESRLTTVHYGFGMWDMFAVEEPASLGC